MTEELSPPLARAAERLRHAGSTRRPCSPVRDLIGSCDVDAAYAVQEHVVALQEISGARVVGRKIGMVARAVQLQLGVNQPTIGTLLDTMQVQNGDPVPVSQLMQPLIEAEIAIRLSQDLDIPDVDESTARRAVAELLTAMEIVDSRIADWDISLVDTIADNASAGLFVLGPEGRPLGDADLGTWKMTMRRNGTVVSKGAGRDNAHGDPIKGLVWLAREAQRRGRPLLRDEIVLAGSLGPMVPIEEGDYFTAAIENMPVASVHFLPSSVARAGSKTPLVG